MRPFKIEIRHEDLNTTMGFGPRFFGESGKDILAVKVALGLVLSTESAIAAADSGDQPDPNYNPAIPLDDQGWFDCGTGSGIDIKKASNFDHRLKNALINFQINNQFLIVSYLFEKYGIKSLISSLKKTKYKGNVDEEEEYSQDVIYQIESALKLFENEVGTLQEATLAVMHGWRPHSFYTQKGYEHKTYTEGDVVTDIIPQVIFKDLQQGVYGQTIQELEENYIIFEGSALENSEEKMDYFLRKSPSSSRWFPPPAESEENFLFGYFGLQYGSVDYVPVLEPSSILYNAAISVLENTEVQQDETLLSYDDRASLIRNMLYPDPFTDPDPFQINEFEIGFFDRTEFVLSPEGPLPNEQPETLRELEEIALNKVLKHFKKPEIWHFPKSSRRLQVAYFGGQDQPKPTHSGVYPLEITEQMKSYIPRYQEIKASIESKKEEIQTRLQELGGTQSDFVNFWRLPLEDVEQGEHALDDFYRWELSKEEREDLDRIKVLKGEVFSLHLQFDARPTPEELTETFWVLSTNSNLAEAELSDENIAQSWYDIEGYGSTEPLIKFVEYRTPSLRPTERYRAFFIINKEKLDLIQEGTFLRELVEQPTSGTDGTEDELCADENFEESLRTLEEYKKHAKQKRRQLVRKLREKLQEQSLGTHRAIVDLGEGIGPFDLNSAFSGLYDLGLSASDYEYTSKILSMGTELGDRLLQDAGYNRSDLEELNDILEESDSIEQTGPTLTGSPAQRPAPKTSQPTQTLSLTINYGTENDEDAVPSFLSPGLSDRVKVAAADLREADKIIKSKGIKFEPGCNFDANNEATNLENFMTQLAELLESNGHNASKYAGSTIFTFKVRDVNRGIKGPKNGKEIVQINANNPEADFSIFFTEPALSQNKNNFPALVRPRTVNYIYNIKEMVPSTSDNTGRGAGLLPHSSQLKSFFKDNRGACEDLGFDQKKSNALSYVGKYTSGLKASLDKTGKKSQSVKSWYEEFVEDPAIEWWKKSKDNWKDSFNDTLDEEQVLEAFGKLCTLDDLYREFFDKVSLPALLCDYVKCLKLPGFELKLPSFKLPPFPKVPIIGWYDALIDLLKKQWRQILIRILCSFVRTIIDKLAFPFCEEQLEEFIAAGSSASDVLNEALIDSFLNTGVPNGKEEESKAFFQDAANILTPEELCHCLSGKQLNPATMTILERLVEKNNLSEDLTSYEEITNYFGVLGSYLPFDLCDEIVSQPPVDVSCDELADAVSLVRNILTTGSGEVTDDQIVYIANLAEKNNQDRLNSLRALSGAGLDNIVPPVFEPGNSAALMSNLPDQFKTHLQEMVEALFSSARTDYIFALSSYIESMRVSSPYYPWPGEEEYDYSTTLKLETALEQLSNFSTILEVERFQLVRGNPFAEMEPDQLLEMHAEKTALKESKERQLEELMRRFKEIAGVETPNTPGRLYNSSQNADSLLGQYVFSLEGYIFALLGLDFSGGDDVVNNFFERPWSFSTQQRRTSGGPQSLRPAIFPFQVGVFGEELHQRISNNNQRVFGGEVNLGPPSSNQRPSRGFIGSLIKKMKEDLRNITVISGLALNPGDSISEGTLIVRDSDISSPLAQRSNFQAKQTAIVSFLDKWWEKFEEAIEEFLRSFWQKYGEKHNQIGILASYDVENIKEVLSDIGSLYELQNLQIEFSIPEIEAASSNLLNLLRNLNPFSDSGPERDDHLIWNNRMALQRSYSQFDPKLISYIYRCITHIAESAQNLGLIFVEVNSILSSLHTLVPEIAQLENELPLIENAAKPPKVSPRAVQELFRLFDIQLINGHPVHRRNIFPLAPTQTDLEFRIRKSSSESPGRRVSPDSRGFRRVQGEFLEPEDNLANESIDFVEYSKAVSSGRQDPPQEFTLVFGQDIFSSSRLHLPIRERDRSSGNMRRALQNWIHNPARDPENEPEDSIDVSEVEIYHVANSREPSSGVDFEAFRIDNESRSIVDAIQGPEENPHVEDDPRLLEIVNSRINFLTQTITNIIAERRDRTFERHLPMLKRALVKSEEIFTEISYGPGEEMEERIDFADSEEDEELKSSLALNFSSSIYAPKIKMIEHFYSGPYLPDRADRYDIEIEGDFILRQTGNGQKKIFKFCELLPNWLDQNNFTTQDRTYPKRLAWANVFMKSAKNLLGPEGRDTDFRNFGSTKTFVYKDLYKSTTESMMEDIFYSMYNSDMFSPEYARKLDARVGGRPYVNELDNCLKNRYNLSHEAILAFNKTIIKGFSEEITAELAKPENSLYNRSFGEIGATEKAIINISVKGFIRVCLIDLLLKGGIAYAVWDIEPIVSSPLFIQYAHQHVMVELKRSTGFKDLWESSVETMAGIENPSLAVESIVKTELLNLPNFSRQVYNPNEPEKDFYNWYLSEFIPSIDVSRVYNRHHGCWELSIPDNQEKNIFFGKSCFIVEHYVKVSGQIIEHIKENTRISLTYEVDEQGNFTSDLLNEQLIGTREFDSLIRSMHTSLGSSQTLQIVANSHFIHGSRLVQCHFGNSEQVATNYDTNDPQGRHLLKELIEMFPGGTSKAVAKKNKTYRMLAKGVRTNNYFQLVADQQYPDLEEVVSSRYASPVVASCIPLSHYEREISLENCASAFQIRGGISDSKTKNFMEQNLMETREAMFVLENVFPARRFMAMSSIFATSVLGGYGPLPNLMRSTKNMLSVIANKANTPFHERQVGLPGEEFNKTMKDKFPGDIKDADCLEFPSISKEIWEKFWDELGELIKQFPSILFRGIANTLDPAYKEMRAHWLNCDIEELKWQGMGFHSVDKTLVNGLKKRAGSVPGDKKRNGNYVPVFPAALVDLSRSLTGSPRKLPRRLLKTTLKTVSYIYSGNLPFIDLEGLFAIPCFEINENWLKGKRYDAGRYGRYGHPLSPFTALALSTPHLRSDLDIRNATCEEQVEEECEEPVIVNTE